MSLVPLQELEERVARLDPGGVPVVDRIHVAHRPGRHLGVLSASFNPLTQAHVAMIEKAHHEHGLDEILLLLAKANVDKEIFGASLAQRLDMLQRYCVSRSYLSLGISSHGRFVDKIEALRRIYPPSVPVTFLLGYDTLVRLFDAKYYQDRDTELAHLFDQCDFLVANRDDHDERAIEQLLDRPANAPYVAHIRLLHLDPFHAHLSSTQIRERLADGRTIEGLVPPEIADYIAQHQLYTPSDERDTSMT